MGTWSTWKISSDKLLEKITRSLGLIFTITSFWLESKQNDWQQLRLCLTPKFFQPCMIHFFLIWSSESVVPDTVFPYAVKSYKYFLLRMFSQFLSRIATIFTFTSNQHAQHFFMRCFPLIRMKNSFWGLSSRINTEEQCTIQEIEEMMLSWDPAH